MSQSISKRLSYWFTYNLAFALFPLVASVTLHYLADKSLYVALVKSPEILFFTIMTTATALGDVSDVPVVAELEIWCRLARFLLILGAVFSTFLYGVLLYENIIRSGSIELLARLLNISGPLSVIYFVIGTVVEVLVGRIEGMPPDTSNSN